MWESERGRSWRLRRGDFEAWPDAESIDWLSAIRWQEAAPVLLKAERSMALLDASFWIKEASSLWLPSLFVRHAAAEAGTAGPTTTAERLRLLEGGLNDWIPTRGDHEGLLILRNMQRTWERYRLGRLDEEMAYDTLMTAGGEIVDLEEITQLTNLSVPFDRETDARKLFDLLKGVGGLSYSLPPLLKAVAALRSIMQSGLGGDGSGRIGRLVLPLFLRWRARRLPAPIYLSHAFASNAYRMAPGGDMTVWMTRICEAIHDEAAQSLQEIDLVEQALEKGREVIGQRRSQSQIATVHATLLAKGVCTASGLARSLSRGNRRLTPRGARLLLQELVELGLVQEITGRKSYCVYAPASFVQSRLISEEGLGLGRRNRLSSRRGGLTLRGRSLEADGEQGSDHPPAEPLEIDDAAWERLLEETDIASQRIARLLGDKPSDKD